DLSERGGGVAAVKGQRSRRWRAAGAGRVLGGGTGRVACHDVILARTGRDPPHTHQSSRTLAAFRPWGIWRDKRRARGLLVSLAGRDLSCGRSPTPAAPVSFPAEDSPSGLGRTLGKRVGGNPSGVRISYPPPPVTRQYVRPVMRSAWPARLRSLICSLTHIGIKRPKVQAHASSVTPEALSGAS